MIAPFFATSGEQGWRCGESTRLQPMWPVFDFGLVLGVFLWVLWFSSPYKNQQSKFQLAQDRGPALKPMWLPL